MAEVIISNPNIEVNDEKIAIYGNTAVVDLGMPDVGVTSLSAGSGANKTVHGVDITTAVGMIKFKIPSTPESLSLFKKWKANPAGNVVKIYGEGMNETLLGASLSEGREFELNSSEGGIEITFRGDSMATV